MRLVWQFVAVAAVAFIGGQGLAAGDGNPWLTLALGVPTAVLAVLVYGWVVRRTERRPSVEVAAKGAGAGLGLGTLIGFAVFGLVILQLATNGYYEINGRGSTTGAVGLVGFMAAAAVTEELLFRGVLFRITEERTGTWIAMTLTGVLFGVYHLANPDASLWGTVAVAVEGGGMLTAAYIATRKLWVPIGVHFGWNFAAAGIFSSEVSGNGANQGLLDTTASGPQFVTGGDFGPEGSVFSVLFCVLATIVFMWAARRRGRLVPRRRADRVDATTKMPQ
ncbi:CPBP family intramembrane glutamic endopeptidase [Streptomyces sp. NBC_01187]|uniref:CPBP family intramembrane glutamic endopeptidase n=1 Tax=Streptomyces sp. NBC_01187 TaxID=2903766 RepID=UPI003866CBC2|nr:CPBP family intramembrane metalloprotease [Streptomyces sp. NBC_01187]